VENSSNLNIITRERVCLFFLERGQDGRKEGRAGNWSAYSADPVWTSLDIWHQISSKQVRAMSYWRYSRGDEVHWWGFVEYSCGYIEILQLLSKTTHRARISLPLYFYTAA